MRNEDGLIVLSMWLWLGVYIAYLLNV